MHGRGIPYVHNYVLLEGEKMYDEKISSEKSKPVKYGNKWVITVPLINRSQFFSAGGPGRA